MRGILVEPGDGMSALLKLQRKCSGIKATWEVSVEATTVNTKRGKVAFLGLMRAFGQWLGFLTANILSPMGRARALGLRLGFLDASSVLAVIGVLALSLQLVSTGADFDLAIVWVWALSGLWLRRGFSSFVRFVVRTFEV
jgi:hypothetical protein